MTVLLLMVLVLPVTHWTHTVHFNLNAADAFNITFKNNSFANRTGELITITPAYHCVQTYSDRKHLDMGNMYNKIFHSSATMIKSIPIKVCVCKNVTSFTCI